MWGQRLGVFGDDLYVDEVVAAFLLANGAEQDGVAKLSGQLFGTGEERRFPSHKGNPEGGVGRWPLVGQQGKHGGLPASVHGHHFAGQLFGRNQLLVETHAGAIDQAVEHLVAQGAVSGNELSGVGKVETSAHPLPVAIVAQGQYGAAPFAMVGVHEPAAFLIEPDTLAHGCCWCCHKSHGFHDQMREVAVKAASDLKPFFWVLFRESFHEVGQHHLFAVARHMPQQKIQQPRQEIQHRKWQQGKQRQ